MSIRRRLTLVVVISSWIQFLEVEFFLVTPNQGNNSRSLDTEPVGEENPFRTRGIRRRHIENDEFTQR